MDIDVLINSCARPDVLSESISSFLYRVKTSHNFRFVLLEDMVDDIGRRNYSRSWILRNSHLFDEVVFLEEKAGPGFFFAPIVKLCRSEYFFHLEDDNDFIVDIFLDDVIDFMSKYDNIAEVILSRGNLRNENIIKQVHIDGLDLTEMKLFSVSTGLFKTNLVKKLISKIGWDKQLHENKVLTPVSLVMGYRKYMLGYGDQHYIHVGELKNYRKGSWLDG